MAAVVDDAHVEAPRAAGHGAADAPEAEDAERLAPDVGAAELIEIPAAPLAGAGESIAFNQAAGDGQDQRPGQVGGGFIEHAGGIGDGDLAARTGGEVDVVVADADVGDDAQSGRGGEDFVVNALGDQGDERIFAGDAAQDFGARRAFGPVPVVDVEMFGQARARRVEEHVRREYAWAAHSFVCAEGSVAQLPVCLTARHQQQIPRPRCGLGMTVVWSARVALTPFRALTIVARSPFLFL